MTTTHPTAALTWKGLILLLVAIVGIVGGVLWVWWTPAKTSSSAAPPTAQVPGDQPEDGDQVAGGGGVPVRILVMTMATSTATVDLCDTPTTEVLIRWYASNPPSGPILDQQKITVIGGSATFPLKPGLFPSAQSLKPNGRPAGKEVAPGQAGNCP